MQLKEQRLSWVNIDGGENRLFVHQFDTTSVFVADTVLAAEAVASRHLCGREKQILFRDAVADIWRQAGSAVLGDWSGDVVECVVLRGADHVRPENPADLIGRKMVRTAIRLHRREVSPGNWAAEIVKGEGENENVLFAAEQVVVWEGCSASGSTLTALLHLLKHQNGLGRVLVICPFMGGFALRQMEDLARALKIQLTVLCFGVYRVAPQGWENKTWTDIYIPSDRAIDDSRSLAIPSRQRRAYRLAYRPREIISGEGISGEVSWDDDGFCLVGDVGESMGSPEEQLQYVRDTIRAWPVFCGTPVPDDLARTRARLEEEARLAAV
ncbi:MAG: hypothetical protein V1723_01710 [Candidatus Uhrbacteria bacterium]